MQGLLCLGRKTDESVMIGDDIEVIIVSIRGDKVRLGFKAPRETPIHRREVYDKIKRDGVNKKQLCDVVIYEIENSTVVSIDAVSIEHSAGDYNAVAVRDDVAKKINGYHDVAIVPTGKYKVGDELESEDL